MRAPACAHPGSAYHNFHQPYVIVELRIHLSFVRATLLEGQLSTKERDEKSNEEGLGLQNSDGYRARLI